MVKSRAAAPPTPLHVVLLEDSQVDADLILDELRSGGYALVSRRVTSREEMLEALDGGGWQLVLLDYPLPGGGTALEALAALAGLDIDLPAILISGVIGEEEAADALRAGARDFVNKSNLTRLVPAVAREFEQVEARRREREGAAALGRSEQRLGESEERFRLIAEHARDLIALLDADGRYSYLSPSCESVLGYRPGELLGTLASDLLHPDDDGSVGDLASGGLREARLRKADGTWLWVEGLSYAIAGPTDSRFAQIARDISERKRAEVAREYLQDELRHSQKLEAVGRLAGGIAHDFNNLLTVISGYTQILLRRTEASKEISEINNAAVRAARLTRQLLAYSRKQLLEPCAIDLNALVTEMHEMLGGLIGENIEFSTELDSQLESISADVGQIEQIVMNLVVNACDAMPEGGSLIVATRSDVLEGRVMLAVTDTGQGMDEAAIARIFEPFYTTKERDVGTGLGLSTVDGIVQQSGGHVEVESEPGKGTTFRAFFPAVAELPAASSPKAPDERPLTGSETVLLAEDEDAVRGLGKQILELFGYSVLVAADGVEALEVAASHPDPIHLLMTDLRMPRMGGVELAERLSLLRPELKVLYTSGSGGSLQDLVGAPCLAKPYALEDLARTLRDLLDPAASDAPLLPV